ncbi:hypothetical protein HMPREF1580_00453 [Gardnerella vaginalis JCP8070]|nr:hypothetical protein HMPREF1582_01188 [Gardnerella vaginalis JCP8151A]EPI46732.1 hypothetical protein HMPREF1583_00899 [Gardnerella vaginalis JCP8151B]EPI60378.1 hypothetical protein HMPREF1580_00453 [Gardnerella vaginalis JCP8070]KXA16090.1 hypothetical protein HMPREF3204_00891 [Gardnerella pickettii]
MYLCICIYAYCLCNSSEFSVFEVELKSLIKWLNLRFEDLSLKI